MSTSYDPAKSGYSNQETCLVIRYRDRTGTQNYRWLSIDLVNAKQHELESVLKLLGEDLTYYLNLKERNALTVDEENAMRRVIYYLSSIKREVIARRKRIGRAQALFYKEFYEAAREQLQEDHFQRVLDRVPEEVVHAARG